MMILVEVLSFLLMLGFQLLTIIIEILFFFLVIDLFGQFLFNRMIKRGKKMFRYDCIGIMSEYSGLELLVRCGVFTEVNKQLSKSRLGEISLLKLFGDFLVEVKHL